MGKSSKTSDKWYWSKRDSDERNGPVSGEKLKELAEEGELEPDDLVWTKGMNDWKEAGSIEDLEDLFVSPPPLPEESSQESVEEDAPPSLPQSEKNKESRATKTEGDRGDRGEYHFPMQFEVEWGGSLWTNEATLELRESGVSLKTNDTDHGGEVDYGHIEIGEIDGNDVTLQAPFAVSRDEAGKAEYLSSKNHHLTFESKDYLKRAVGAIESVKSGDVLGGEQANTESSDDKVTAKRSSTSLPQGDSDSRESRATKYEAFSCIHDYNENEVCRKCGWSKNDLKSLDESLDRKEISRETADTSEEDEGASWYWAEKHSEERNGPISWERLKKQAIEGKLDSEDLVWKKGFDDWKEAGSVGEIEQLLLTPPSLPDEQGEEDDATNDEPPVLPQEESEEEGDPALGETSKAKSDSQQAEDLPTEEELAAEEVENETSVESIDGSYDSDESISAKYELLSRIIYYVKSIKNNQAMS